MKIIQSNFGTIKVIDPVVPDSRTTAQGTYGKFAAQIASGGRVKYRGAGLVDYGPTGVRQGYAEKKPRGGQKKPEKIETLRKLIAEANAGMKYFTWETIAARMNITRDAAYMLAKKKQSSAAGFL